MVNQQDRNGANAVFLNTTYAYDLADRLTVQTDSGSARTFTYDTTDQLTADSTNTYTYDANGNRNNGSYATGSANQVSSDGTWTYTYNDAGNRTKKSKGASAETWTYQYDTGNNLTRVEKRATDGGTLQSRIDYTYDVYGNRLSRTEYNGSLSVVSASRYGYDGWKTGSGASFLGQENWDVWADLDTSNALVTRRVFGNSVDDVAARVSSAGAVVWYDTDRQGSVRALTNASGTSINTVTYDGFGMPTQTNSANGDRYLFQGREFETLTGLSHNRAREFDLQQARGLQRDPLGFDADPTNLTRFVDNAATNGSDPSGMRPAPGTATGPVAPTTPQSRPGANGWGPAVPGTTSGTWGPQIRTATYADLQYIYGNPFKLQGEAYDRWVAAGLRQLAKATREDAIFWAKFSGLTDAEIKEVLATADRPQIGMHNGPTLQELFAQAAARKAREQLAQAYPKLDQDFAIQYQIRSFIVGRKPENVHKTLTSINNMVGNRLTNDEVEDFARLHLDGDLSRDNLFKMFDVADALRILAKSEAIKLAVKSASSSQWVLKSADEIAENFGLPRLEKHGDPTKWERLYTKSEPLTQRGARPGEKKVYEVWQDEFGKKFEWHYEVDEHGSASTGKYVFPSTTSKPR